MSADFFFFKIEPQKKPLYSEPDENTMSLQGIIEQYPPEGETIVDYWVHAYKMLSIKA